MGWASVSEECGVDGHECTDGKPCHMLWLKSSWAVEWVAVVGAVGVSAPEKGH